MKSRGSGRERIASALCLLDHQAVGKQLSSDPASNGQHLALTARPQRRERAADTDGQHSAAVGEFIEIHSTQAHLLVSGDLVSLPGKSK
jgi:hypothetical protein